MQVYVFDSYELTLFNQLVLESLDDPVLAPHALQLLFYFQDEGLAQQEQQPEPEVPYPIVVLTGVIRELVALPAPLVLRLPEVLQALPVAQLEHDPGPQSAVLVRAWQSAQK